MHHPNVLFGRALLRFVRQLHGFEEDPPFEATAADALVGGERKKLHPGHADGSGQGLDHLHDVGEFVREILGGGF
jgi:hypothetical protein